MATKNPHAVALGLKSAKTGFTGSGTTGAVAIRHQRSFVGTELNPAYVELARQRIGAVAPLLAQEVA